MTKKGFDLILTKFLSNYLFLRTNDEVQHRKPFPNINRVYLNNLKQYYDIRNKEEDEEEGDSSSEEEENPFDVLRGKQI